MALLQVVLQSIAALAVLFLLCRLGGTRQISQLTMFDYINSISIGSIAAELATDLEHWEKPLIAMILFGLATALVNWANCKSLRLRKWMNGVPLILYHKGTLYRKNLLRSMLDIHEFLSQCRVAGYFDLNQLEYVIMETNGQLSFYPKNEESPVTPRQLALQTQPAELFITLICDGKLLPDNLARLGKERHWLEQQLHARGIGQISQVFYACCSPGGSFFCCRMPNEVDSGPTL